MCGVYAVGRPELSECGRWMAAVLFCGPGAMLSHQSAGAAWGIRSAWRGPITISVPANRSHRAPGIRVHRRKSFPQERASNVSRIPVTDPVMTLLDLAAILGRHGLESAINKADKRDLVSPDVLRGELRALAGRPGVAKLRACLDRHTFVLTDSELERRFLPIAQSAGLSPPVTGRRVTGFKVDFFWPNLGLVVETDGLRYHRTPAQQAKDRRRDQAHARAGLTTLRFTHAQVRYEPREVRRTLAEVASRCRRTPANERIE